MINFYTDNERLLCSAWSAMDQTYFNTLLNKQQTFHTRPPTIKE